MAKNKKRNTGAVPGSVVFTGQRKVEHVAVHYLEYNELEMKEEVLDNRSIQTFHQPVDEYVQWYDIRGLHDTDLIEELGQVFQMHPLILEDIADVEQRPKYDEYDEGNFFTFRALSFDKKTDHVEMEQVAIYFGKGFVISFQERETDLFAEVRERIHKSAGRIRKRKVDYLVYSLLDSVTDDYFSILDNVETRLEELEVQIAKEPKNELKTQIHGLKQEMIKMRKSVSPLRESVGKFLRSDSSLIDEKTTLYIQDLYDHTIQIMDMVESYRDSLNGLQDLFMSEVSFKMNQVMQLLTVVTTVFIPLSFLTGLYGMNFVNIPELQTKNGYFILLGVMLFLVIALLLLFKRRKWL